MWHESMYGSKKRDQYSAAGFLLESRQGTSLPTHAVTLGRSVVQLLNKSNGSVQRIHLDRSKEVWYAQIQKA